LPHRLPRSEHKTEKVERLIWEVTAPDWELMLKAVRHHTNCPWVLLYIERRLKAPVQLEDGNVVLRTSGTPQGGVVQRLRFARDLNFPNDLARVIHNADASLLDRNVQSRKMVHAALLLLMLEAVDTDLVSPSA
jgi:hypothetical protein